MTNNQVFDGLKSQTPTQLCAAGINSYVRWQSDAMPYLDASINADQDYALPRLVKAWMLQGGRDSRFTETVRGLVSHVEAGLPYSGLLDIGLAKTGSTSDQNREALLCSALIYALDGKGIEAATILENILHNNPKDLLAHQIIQNELFWMGRVSWMRDVVERAAPEWNDSDADYGRFLSIRAFANEEAGSVKQAEQFARQALELDPTDLWGAHAVAHVLLMKGEMQNGIDKMMELSPNWGHGNQLKHHLWWHICLFLLETGEHQRIVELLTTEIRNPDSELVKAAPAAAIDIQNFASLLMRLELYGVDVTEHWATLSSICAERIHNHGNAFCNIHDMMVLTATGQSSAADQMLMSMKETYGAQTGSVALSYNAAGIPASEAVIAHRNKNHKRVLELLGPIRHDMHLMGASHAQRDVLYHMLVDSARQEGRDDLKAVFLRDIERIGFCEVPGRAAYA